jgi:glycosyltransferase 2 family protein
LSLRDAVASLPRPAVRAAQFGVAAGLLAILWHAADGEAALRLLAGADPVWLLAAMAALTMQTVLSALRWRLTAEQLGIAFTVRAAVREYYLSQVLNQSLPGGMLGDASRAVRSRSQAGLVRSGQAVVLERLMGQVVMVLLLALGFAATWIAPGGLDWPRWVAIPLAAALACGLALPGLVWLGARLPGAAGRATAGFRDAAVLGLMSRGVLARQVALSIGTAGCILIAFACCAAALGVALPLVAVVTIVPVILFSMLVPVTVSGWGVREGAASALFPIAGATATEGFATSVAFGLVFVVTVLPGLLPLLSDRISGTVRP